MRTLGEPVMETEWTQMKPEKHCLHFETTKQLRTVWQPRLKKLREY